MAIVALTNSSSPVTVERATADSDPYSRETQLNGLALNFDAHDHTSAKGLAVGRLQTPAVSGVMTFGGDATLSRTGAGALRVDTHLGVGVNPAAWEAAMRALQVGPAGAVWSNPGAVRLSYNTIYSGGASQTALIADLGMEVQVGSTGFTFRTAPSVAAGAAQTFTTRMALVPTGTLTLSPDAGQAALVLGTGGVNNLIRGLTGPLLLQGDSNGVWPNVDNNQTLGAGTNRWIAVYAVNGSIQTSSREYKEGITPLDPAACYQAAKDVRWYEFAYLPPAYTAPEPPPEIAYDAADDNETKAEKKAARDEAESKAKAAHLKMVAETAPARNQRGFVFPTGAEEKDEAGEALPPVPELFGLSDRESTTPQADIATLGAALQHLIAKVEALEAAA